MGASAEDFTVVEAGISELQAAMSAGRVTSRRIVEEYLARIDEYDALLHATLAVNPRALEAADRLDRERAAGTVRGPLHGVPIALKDNIQTADMPTTGGALAFEGFVPPCDAPLVSELRTAGAIILAKTTLTELANWVAPDMPNGYNALIGHGMNPYDPRPDPRPGRDDGRCVLDPDGSSSGAGTAANLWAANIGTETCGSIQGPASHNMLAFVKPTVGSISRRGIIPITVDQDTAGPLAKCVTDLALLLDVLVEAVDPGDPTTKSCSRPTGGYARCLDARALRGARIGIPRAYFYDAITPPGCNAPMGGLDPAATALMSRAIEILERAGAVLIDPVEIPSITAPRVEDNLLRFATCGGEDGDDETCSSVLRYGMQRDFNAWLDALGDKAPVASLAELREFNLANRARGAIVYGQALLDRSDAVDLSADRARYLADRAKDLRLSRTEGLDAALHAHRLDALLFPAGSGEELINKAGYPAVGVPFGCVPNACSAELPAEFDPQPLPFGITFVGAACSEARLLALAYAFEQLTRARRAPPAFP